MERIEMREKRRQMKERMREFHKPSALKRVVFGLVVLTAGILLLAKSMGYIPDQVGTILFSWPMLLVGLGFINLFGRGFIGGIAMLMVGFYFLPLETLGLTLDVKRLLIPIGLILAGIFILIFWKRFNPFHHHHSHINCCGGTRENGAGPNGGSDDFFEDFAIFGGARHVMNSTNFRGGQVLAIFGGSEIDMTRSKLSADSHSVIKLVCVFGGVGLIVPEDWDVEIRVISILGGFADKRRYQPKEGEGRKKLYIRGIALLGGGEIRTEIE